MQWDTVCFILFIWSMPPQWAVMHSSSLQTPQTPYQSATLSKAFISSSSFFSSCLLVVKSAFSSLSIPSDHPHQPPRLFIHQAAYFLSSFAHFSQNQLPSSPLHPFPSHHPLPLFPFSSPSFSGCGVLQPGSVLRVITRLVNSFMDSTPSVTHTACFLSMDSAHMHNLPAYTNSQQHAGKH